jgi:hypothetical protein
MSSAYVYRKPVKRSRYADFRRRLFFSILVLLPFIAVGVYIYLGLHNKPDKPVTSAVENTEITDNKVTTVSDLFQFQDRGPWVFDTNDSTPNKLTYHKFRKKVLLHEMVIYINQVPIPLYLATPRVLPVHIVNNDSLQVTNVSDPCGGQYAKGELHKVKELSIDGATMLCDPDNTQYFVILSEVNGDYRLHLKRPNGTPVQFVITYKDVGLNPTSTDLINVASSFQTR